MGKDSLKKGKELEIIFENEYNVYNKVLLKYKIMKMRLKISFMALLKNYTVPELFYNAIIGSCQQRANNGGEGVCKCAFTTCEKTYSYMLDGDHGTIKRCLEKQIGNNPELSQNTIFRNNL